VFDCDRIKPSNNTKFLCNAIELKGKQGFIALSLTAFHALNRSQKTLFSNQIILLAIAVSTIRVGWWFGCVVMIACIIANRVNLLEKKVRITTGKRGI